MKLKDDMQATKKIIFVASYAESLINFRLHLMQEFLAKQYEVIAVSPYNSQVRAKLTALGIRCVNISLDRNGKNPIRDLFFLGRLFLLFYKERPHIIFSYTIKPVIYGTLAARLAKIGKIYSMITGLGYTFNDSNLKNKLIGIISQNLFKLSLRFNNKIFFQNKDDLDLFRNKKLMPRQQPIAVINGSGVDIHHYYPRKMPPTLSFLMMARLLGDKGVREYVEAARLVKAEYPDIIFKLGGWIDSNPNAIGQHELSQWIKSGYIEYLGKLTEVREAIGNSSVFVLPSYGEGTPRSVLEAMSMGRPIITTDVPGCRETVINQKNGFLVQARNVNALSLAMKYFIQHPGCIANMGEESRKIAVEKFEVNKVNQILLSEMGV